MIQKIRLQRKFTLKNKVSLTTRTFQIVKMMIFYELTMILFICLLTLSLHFNLSHLFPVQFWNNEQSINSNLSIALSTFLLIPYLIFIQNTSVSLVQDLIATALILQTIIGVILNGNLELSFIIYMIVIGSILMVLGNYVAIMREQRNLIKQISIIQKMDRHQGRLSQEEHDHLHERGQMTEMQI